MVLVMEMRREVPVPHEGPKGLRGPVGWSLDSAKYALEAGCTLKACATLTHLPAQDDLHHMHRRCVEPEISYFYIFSCSLTQKEAGLVHGANVAQLQLCVAEAEIRADRAP
jgi:hypothetical protein